MLRRVTHNATFSHLPFAHLELGFDQNDQVGGGGQQGDERGKDQSDGDERNINGHDFRERSDPIKGEVARIGFFQDDDSRVLPQLPVKLIRSPIHGEDLARHRAEAGNR